MGDKLLGKYSDKFAAWFLCLVRVDLAFPLNLSPRSVFTSSSEPEASSRMSRTLIVYSLSGFEVTCKNGLISSVVKKNGDF